MANKFLLREDAPVEPKTWTAIDNTVINSAKSILAGRRILPVEGPYGLGLKGIPTMDDHLEGGLISSSFVPVQFIQSSFLLTKRDIAAHERDGLPLDTSAVADAAIESARIEDTMIFNGAQNIAGLFSCEGTASSPISSWDKVGNAAEDVIRAITRLDENGFHGPFALALAPARYNMLLRRYPQSDGTELEHIRTMATEGVVKVPILEKGGILLAPGPQFASIVIGQDMAAGFIGPVEESLEFSISESLALVIRDPGSICVLKEK
ncbi:MAG: bacteriocin family protein [Methanomicrobiales archaeon]|nr:bacteriocin family protein [Methanomicrobiales archaeon]